VPWLRIIGTILQLAGLLLAAQGVAERRKVYAPDQRGILGSVKQVIGAGLDWMRQRVGLPPRRPKRVSAGASLEIRWNAHAHGTVTYGALPATTQAELIDILDKRTQRLREDLNNLDTAWRKADVQSLKSAVGDIPKQSQAQLANAMANGLNREATGLALAAVGTVLAAFG
jgi:hypothetical protein